METRQASRHGIFGAQLVLRLLVGAALALPPALVLAHAARAAGVVTDCTNYSSSSGLGAALAAGGNITFNCAGAGRTIIFPAQFDLTTNVSIDGSDQGRNDVTLSGNNLIRLFGVHVATTLNLSNLTISNGQATKVSADGTNAGAIANLGGTLNITNVTFSMNNSAGRGGAIVTMLNLDCFDPSPPNPPPPPTCGAVPTYVGGTTTVTNSTFTQNTAATDAGALQVFGTDRGGTNTHGQVVTLNVINSTFTANKAAAGMGGAIFNYMGALNVRGSTFTGNTAGAAGGAIAETNVTATSGAASVTLSNSTLAKNTSTGTGGAIENFNGVLRITNSTINNNTATGNGGAIDQMALSPADVTISNTIVANNTAAPGTLNCNGVNAAEDGGNNLEFPAPTTCMFATNAQTGDPKLGPLANNGGPTQTEALLPGSAAIGKGSAAICAAAPVGGVDQRGLPRYEALRGVCDIGAYDTGGGIVPPLTVTGAIPLTTGVPARLGFATSNHSTTFSGVPGVPPFNIGYITFQLGASTFTVRQPVTIACTSAAGGLDHCLGTTGLVNGAPGFVAVPGTATLTLSGTISSARGAYQQGQVATVTLTINVSASGVLTVTKVTVAVAGAPVATWTALPAGTSIQVDDSAPLIL
jgi:hypothetical protein